MNKADSERIRALLESWGLRPAQDIESADAIILNSCVVRQKAENRVLSKIGTLAEIKKKRPNVSIILTGCLVDGQTDEHRYLYPHIDAFFKPGQFSDLINWGQNKGFSNRAASSIPIPSYRSPTAFIPVIEGCDNFCSYCIVPYRRGREKSRPRQEIICEVQELTRRGVREVTLVGQNVNSYGHDLPERPDLVDLLKELNGINGLYRLRFLTSHPKDVTPRLIIMIPQMEKVCEHISLPAQAGSDDILKDMKRGYTNVEYRELIQQIRQLIPNVALSTDIIVGFPGETEEQFQETYLLLEEIRFDTVHVAAYSPRPGTVAARTLEDDIPGKVKKERLKKIEELQEKISAGINALLVGKIVEILVEKRVGDNWMGRTKTNKLVFLRNQTNLIGRLVLVRITRSSPWSMMGEFVSEANGVPG